MRAEEQFDSFYLKTRRALVHQTFALTGDRAAAEHAVRDAYVAAWHHWRKVKILDDQADWVRPRAWALAQRRHSARLWQRTKDLSGGERAVLNALHSLRVPERRALLLAHLAEATPEVSARELNLTQAALRRQIDSATARFATALHIEPEHDALRARLDLLEDAAARAALPRPHAIRRAGRSRRRTHTLIAAAAVVFLAVGSGAFAHQPAAETPEAGPLTATPGASGTEDPADTRAGPAPEPESTLPTAEDLLAVEDVRALAPEARWRVVSTHDNTSGKGINYVCQQERFADPEGLAALVQKVETPADRGPKVVQAVEISASQTEAADTYDRVVSWFATCEGGDLQLRGAFDVEGVAERSMLLDLVPWRRPRMSYAVEIAQVGQVVSTSVIRSIGDAPRARGAVRILEQASRKICERSGEAGCSGRPGVEPVGPPRVQQPSGVLTGVDLPPLTGVRAPWVGTKIVGAAGNPAATSCDRAAFRRMGAVRARTRTFLVPQARLPNRFGLTETYGMFGSARNAAGFLRTVRTRFERCEDRDLTADVQLLGSLRQGPLDGSIWRLRTELSESEEVVYEVGFVRRGDTVAQVTFVPAGGADLRSGAFGALVVRAGQRLAGLR